MRGRMRLLHGIVLAVLLSLAAHDALAVLPPIMTPTDDSCSVCELANPTDVCTVMAPSSTPTSCSTPLNTGPTNEVTRLEIRLFTATSPLACTMQVFLYPYTLYNPYTFDCAVSAIFNLVPIKTTFTTSIDIQVTATCVGPCSLFDFNVEPHICPPGAVTPDPLQEQEIPDIASDPSFFGPGSGVVETCIGAGYTKLDPAVPQSGYPCPPHMDDCFASVSCDMFIEYALSAPNYEYFNGLSWQPVPVAPVTPIPTGVPLANCRLKLTAVAREERDFYPMGSYWFRYLYYDPSDTEGLYFLDLVGPTVSHSLSVSEECTSLANVDTVLDNYLSSGSPFTVTDNCFEMRTTSTKRVIETGRSVSQRCGPTTADVTWSVQAVDICGNGGAVRDITFSIVDTTPPFIVCPADFTDACATDISPSVTGTASASDACTVTPSIAFSDNPQGETTPCLEEVLRVWQATDDCGNSASCQQVIRYGATASINWPADVDVQCFESTASSFTGVPTVFPCCMSSVVTRTETDVVVCSCAACPNNELTVIERTWEVFVDSVSIGVHVQTIGQLQDPLVPVFVFQPPAANVECGGPTDPAATGTATAESCNGVLPVIVRSSDSTTSSCGLTYEIERVWEAEDVCGRLNTYTQTITVVDTTPPVVTAPPDFTAECPSPTDPGATGFAVASDTCSVNTPNVVFSDTVLGACGGESHIRRTWSAEDECGNAASSIQTIHVADTTLPAFISFPNSPILECTGATTPVDPSVTGTPTASDACNLLPLTFNDNVLNTCGNTHIITRVWVASDGCNVLPMSQGITVQDTSFPVLTTPPNIQVEFHESSDPSSTGFASATDVCDANPSVTHFDTFQSMDMCSYTMTRHWTARDACDNGVTEPQIISAVDDIVPSVSVVDVSGECGTGFNIPAPSISDLVDPDPDVTSSLLVYQPDGCTEVEEIAWTGTDFCGNAATAVQTIIHIDTQPPQLVNVPSNVYQECVAGVDTSPNALGLPTATDVCDRITPSVTFTDSPLGPKCGDAQHFRRTFRTVDRCGQVTTDTQDIEIEDTLRPLLIIPPNVIVECASSSTPAFTGAATATDQCDPSPSVSYEDTVNPTWIDREWTSVDQCGNSVSRTQRITIRDTTMPTSMPAPSPVVLYCGDGAPQSYTPETLPAPAVLGMPAFSDACDSMLSITFDDTVTATSCDGDFAVTRTWTAIDDAGNQLQSTQNIIVGDGVAPVLTIPDDIFVECGADDGPSVTGSASASDDCSIPSVFHSDSVVSGGCAGINYKEREWTAVDSCASSTSETQTIWTIDTTPPTISPLNTAEQTVELECTSGGTNISPAVTGTPSFTDTCSGISSVTFQDVQTVQCGETFDTLRTWTAKDGCGNEYDWVQTILVVDTTNPMVVAPPPILFECGDDPAGLLPVITAPASDTCGDVSVSFSDPIPIPTNAQPCSVPYPRIWTATDECGNSATVTQSIVVTDQTAPSIEVLDPLVIECTDSTAPDEVPEASDQCGYQQYLTVTYSDDTPVSLCGATSMANQFTRKWVATDRCGLQSQSSQLITVIDSEPPILIAPDDVILDCDAVSTTPLVTGLPTALDECMNSYPVPTFSDSVLDLSATCEGNTFFKIERTWSLDDACGNSALPAVQTIFGLDTVPPQFTSPPQSTVVECGMLVAPSPPTAADQCSLASNILITSTTSTNPGCGGTGTVTTTWEITDQCGNSNYQIDVTNIIDTTAPLISAPAMYTEECPSRNWRSDSIASGVPSFSDACSAIADMEVDFTDGNIVPTCGNTGRFVRQWTATDACGLSQADNQIVEIVDTTPPELVISNPSVQIECTGSAPIGGNVFPASSSDVCGSTALDYTDVITPLCGNARSIQRTWQAIDQCGLNTTSVQLLVVQDTTSPSFTGTNPSLVSRECISGYSVGSHEAAPTASDACSSVLVTLETVVTIAGSVCTSDLKHNAQWLAEDACGNEKRLYQTFAVVDTTPPVITPIPNKLLECGDDTTPANTGIPIATDECSGAIISTASDEIIAGACPGSFVIKRTWTAVDDCGLEDQYVQTITVLDTTPPNVSPLMDWSGECPVNLASLPLPPMMNDLCTSFDDLAVAVTYSSPTATCGPEEGSFTRQVIVTDQCGNSKTVSHQVTVDDSTPPQFGMYPSFVQHECTGGSFESYIGETPSVTDDCTDPAMLVVEQSLQPGASCGLAQSGSVRWDVTDCGGSSFAIQSVSVVDTVAPVLIPDSTQTDLFECFAYPSVPPFEVFGGSGRGEIAFPEIPLEMSALADTCDPRTAAQLTESIEQVFLPSLPGGVPRPGFCVVGRYMRQWRVEDSCLNAATSSLAVDIVDTTPPSWQDVELLEDQRVECTAITRQPLWVQMQYPLPGAIDTCVDVDVDASVDIAQTCPGTFAVVRTIVASDTCDNSIEHVQTLSVVDSEPPELVLPEDLELECGLDPRDLMLTGVASAVDQCGGVGVFVPSGLQGVAEVTIWYEDQEEMNLCEGTVGYIERTWFARDACGNIASGIQLIQVRDTIAPSIALTGSGPGIPLVTRECDVLQTLVPPTPLEIALLQTESVVAWDACLLKVQWSDDVIDIVCGGARRIRRTWSARDGCGRTSVVTQLITEEDNSPPRIVLSELSASLPEAIECTENRFRTFPEWTVRDPSLLPPGVFIDACSAPNNLLLEIRDTWDSPGAQQCVTPGLLTRTWRVTDECGNVATATWPIRLTVQGFGVGMGMLAPPGEGAEEEEEEGNVAGVGGVGEASSGSGMATGNGQGEAGGQGGVGGMGGQAGQGGMGGQAGQGGMGGMGGQGQAGHGGMGGMGGMSPGVMQVMGNLNILNLMGADGPMGTVVPGCAGLSGANLLACSIVEEEKPITGTEDLRQPLQLKLTEEMEPLSIGNVGLPPNTEGLKLTVKPGDPRSVTEGDTEFIISAVVDLELRDGEGNVVQLAETAEVCLTVGPDHDDSKDRCLGFWNTTRSKWECEKECVDVDNDRGEVCAPTTHFTSFAVLLSNDVDGAGGCGGDDGRLYIYLSIAAVSLSCGVTLLIMVGYEVMRRYRRHQYRMEMRDHMSKGEQAMSLVADLE